MGQGLPGSATTTFAIRAAIQRSEAPLKELAARYGLDQKTVAKWRRRAFVHDAPMGPKSPRSTVLTAEQEAAAVAFRKHTLLPLDDCLYALQATIPHLARSALHRCFQRHGISRLPELEAQLHEAANVRTAVAFLEVLVEAVPYTIHTVLTDNDVQFCDLPQHRSGPAARYRLHLFDRTCRQHGIEHLTKPKSSASTALSRR